MEKATIENTLICLVVITESLEAITVKIRFYNNVLSVE